jgi:hypothetical protein
MTDAERQAWTRYRAADRELDDARWALIAAVNARPFRWAVTAKLGRRRDRERRPAGAGELRCAIWRATPDHERPPG